MYSYLRTSAINHFGLPVKMRRTLNKALNAKNGKQKSLNADSILQALGNKRQKARMHSISTIFSF